jgi:hypothetical protein
MGQILACLLAAIQGIAKMADFCYNNEICSFKLLPLPKQEEARKNPSF